jgi:SAM-dependent methyltransferase
MMRYEVPNLTTTKELDRGTSAQWSYHQRRVAHWDVVAERMDHWTGLGGYYHKRLTEVYLAVIPQGQRVLEIGCGQGDLLAACKPAYGVGVDFSGEMIRRAQANHPDLYFYHTDVHDLRLEEKFDTIIMSDLVNDLWDVQAVFQQIAPLCTPRTRLVMNFYSRVWELPLGLAQRLHLAKPLLPQNWLTVQDVTGLLHLTDFEVIRLGRDTPPSLCPCIDSDRELLSSQTHSFQLGGIDSLLWWLARWRGRTSGLKNLWFQLLSPPAMKGAI